MAKIVPFNGIRYNSQKVEIKNVVAPPYDVISEKKQEQLYEKSAYNIIRLILGKENINDDDKNNKYSRAAEYLKSWLNDKILIQDTKKSMYIYEQNFEVEGKKYMRTGFLCLLKQEPLFEGTIYPHERTLAKPKVDRLNLTKTCKMNFSPIFGLFEDINCEMNKIFEKIKIKTKNPDIDIIDDDNENHKVWLVEDRETIEKIEKILNDKKIFIADGHHRYETAMNYANEMKKLGKKGNFDYVLSFLCDMKDNGLIIFPTHRVVKLNNFMDSDFFKDLQNHFEIKKTDKKNIRKILEKEFKKNNISFGLYTGNNNYFILTLKNKNVLQNFIKGSKYYRELDVAVLESLIFENILKFSKEDIVEQKHIKYIKDFDETINTIDDKNKIFKIAFIMNPTRVEQIKNVSLSGEVMPQKSTYFYPKLLTGLVLNKFEFEN